MSFLVISSSLNPRSRSQTMARNAFEKLQELGEPASWMDLREQLLPLCDGSDSYTHPRIEPLRQAIAAADGILLASPVYNYDVAAAAKNLVELTGESWDEKVVGFLCSAGGQGSYMAVMGLANSLMLDFRCTIVPRFIYATGRSFEGSTLRDPEVERRIAELVRELVRVARALRPPPVQPSSS